MPHPITRRLSLLAAVLLATACYRYDRVESLAPGDQRELRIELTDAGSASLAPVIGPSVIALEGRVVRQGDLRFTLAVGASMTRDRQERAWQGEPVEIAFADVASYSTRRFDRRRTATVAAGIVGGAIVMARLFGVSVGGSGGPSRGGSSAPK